MTIARGHLIDPSLTRWYHCVTRCVRRAYLPGEQEHNRKEWIDDEALLATSVYIDLNPIAAKIADTPETSDHTSIKQRLEHVDAEGQTAQLEAASLGSALGSLAAAGLEESLCCARLRIDVGWNLHVKGFAASQAKLEEIAERLNVRYVVNLSRCPARRTDSELRF
jgi:hypothetical protein